MSAIRSDTPGIEANDIINRAGEAGVGIVADAQQSAALAASRVAPAQDSAQAAQTDAGLAVPFDWSVRQGYPTSRWSLNLDFTKEALDPRIRYSGGNGKTYWDGGGLLRVAPAGVWPVEFDPDSRERRGRSVWQQQINLYLRSSTIWTGAAGFLGTAAESGFLDPMGGNAAQLITETYTNTEHFANDRYLTITQGETYTFSCYGKLPPEGVPAARFMLRVAGNGNAGSATLDMEDGRTWLTGIGQSLSYEILGGGLVRFWITIVAAVTALSNFRVQLTDSGNRTVYPGRGAGLILFGGQVVQGAQPGHYIPTEGAAVTRPAERVWMPSAGLFPAARGTVVCRWIKPSAPGLDTGPWWLNGGAALRGIGLSYQGDGGMRLSARSVGSFMQTPTRSSGSGDHTTAAVTWDLSGASSRLAISIDGGSVGTSLAGAFADLPSVEMLDVGQSQVTGNSGQRGPINAPLCLLRIHSGSVSDAELQSLGAS